MSIEPCLFLANVTHCSQIAFYELRKKEYPVSGMRVEQQVLEITLFYLLQDRIKRKSARAARNLDTIQRIVHSLFSIWKGLRKKRSDKRKGMAELMREASMGFTRLLRFLRQK